MEYGALLDWMIWKMFLLLIASGFIFSIISFLVHCFFDIVYFHLKFFIRIFLRFY